MKMPADEVVHMVAVRNPLVAAVGTVHVFAAMTLAIVLGGAAVRIHPAHFNDMLVDVLAMYMVQMAVMEIIRMAVVHDRLMPAFRTVHVVMRGVFLTFHGYLPHQRTNQGSEKMSDSR